MTRSENMSRIHGKNTKIEVYVRKLLYAKGFRYRLNDKRFPGRPDIYIGRYRTAIFVNGCFWHSHPGCKLATVPKKNHEFWVEKLERNRARDARNYAALQEMGIRVIVLWDCDIRKMQKDAEFESVMLERLMAEIRGEGPESVDFDDTKGLSKAMVAETEVRYGTSQETDREINDGHRER